MDRRGVIARIASVETTQRADRIFRTSDIHEEGKVGSELLLSRVAKYSRSGNSTLAILLGQDTFDWERQWYPLGFVSYLDPRVPHAKELLGVRLVLWRDAGGTWRCFEDKCPHRLAPLSGTFPISDS